MDVPYHKLLEGDSCVKSDAHEGFWCATESVVLISIINKYLRTQM